MIMMIIIWNDNHDCWQPMARRVSLGMWFPCRSTREREGLVCLSSFEDIFRNIFEGEGGVGLFKSFENNILKHYLRYFGGSGMGWSAGIVLRMFLKIFLRKMEGLSKLNIYPCLISLHNIEGSDGDGHQMKLTWINSSRESPPRMPMAFHRRSNMYCTCVTKETWLVFQISLYMYTVLQKNRFISIWCFALQNQMYRCTVL